MISGIVSAAPGMVPLAISVCSVVVGDQVAGGLAGVHVQAGDAPGVVVVEHQPGALLVGVVEGLAAVVGGVADTLRIASGMSGTFSTLTPCGQGVVSPAGVIHWCGVPSLIHGRDAAVQVQGGAVVREAAIASFGYSLHIGLRTSSMTVPSSTGSRHRPSGPCRSPSCVVSTGQEQVAVRAGRQQVVEDDADRLVLGRGDDRAEALRRGHGERLDAVDQ